MKKIIGLAIVLLTLFAGVKGQQGGDIKGAWLSNKKDVRVEIYQLGEKYFGKIVWSADMYEPDGKTLNKDSRNPDEKMKQRNIAGINVLSGFIYAEGEWTGGEIYDPRSGKTYKGILKLASGKLEVRGFIGSPVIGKTTSWTRAS